ncbi:MAG TPA: S1/P1 Nuclease, partial [Phenylobacterium sp.]|nr:S1/P1 Nuclease [Phenylobacterium sp.]
PNGYTTSRIHGPFEGDFVALNIRKPAVKAAMAPLKAQQGPLEARVAAYLAVTGAKVEPLYALEKAGGFQNADPRGVAFAGERLGAGASELRDLIVEAWNVSPRMTVGYPAISLGDIESGKADAYRSLRSRD